MQKSPNLVRFKKIRRKKVKISKTIAEIPKASYCSAICLNNECMHN